MIRSDGYTRAAWVLYCVLFESNKTTLQKTAEIRIQGGQDRYNRIKKRERSSQEGQ